MTGSSGPLRLLIATRLGNPVASFWTQGLGKLGHTVVALDVRPEPATREDLARWLVPGDVPVVTMGRGSDSKGIAGSVEEILGGRPDIIFGWWGYPILPILGRLSAAMPSAAVVLCVDTYPSASNPITELREALRYRWPPTRIDGAVVYSEEMAAALSRVAPWFRGIPCLALIEPFPASAFVDDGAEQMHKLRLDRTDERPYVIFTGRADYLWSRDIRMAKDAVGPLLRELAHSGVNVAVAPRADLNGVDRLFHYPHFSNHELADGAFAAYVTQFDAHLVLYNEANATIRRRVAGGLSTRLAFAMTSTSPVIVSSGSTFIREHWHESAFGIASSDVGEIVSCLRDRPGLAALRDEMQRRHRSYAFEANGERIQQFLESVAP